MWIMKDALLDLLLDDHLLVPIELDHLLVEYDCIYEKFDFIRVCIKIWLYATTKCSINFDLIRELKIRNYFHFAFIAEYLSQKW